MADGATPVIQRFLVDREVSAEQSWALLAWCHERGASELSLDPLGLRDAPEPLCDAFRLAFARFQLPDAEREHVTTYVKLSRLRPTSLWTLCPESIAALRAFFAEGLFTYPAGERETGWIENPAAYRDGRLMLEIVSHEREGVLRLHPDEEAAFARLGISSRDRPEWTGTPEPTTRLPPPAKKPRR